MFLCGCPREARRSAVSLLCINKDWRMRSLTPRLPPSPGNPSQSTRPPCKKPCALHATCGNCTSHGMECMWCGSRQRCVDSSAYVISFPYGQCLEWQTTECLGKTRGSLVGVEGRGRWFGQGRRWV